LTKHLSLVVVCALLAGSSRGGAQTPVLAPAEISPFDVGSPSGQVLLADIDKDSDIDLLTRHQQARAIRLHLGDGRARFATTEAALAFDFAPSVMRLGDVNGDTFLDLVVTAGARDIVDVLLGSGSAAFTRARGSPFVAGKRTYRYNKRSLHLVDVNGDRDLDIVTANRRGQYAFRVWLGNGRGQFAAGQVLRVEPAKEGYTLAFGDVDRDGRIDAVTALSSPVRGRVVVHLGTRNGSFRRARGSTLTLPPTYRIEALVDMDFDRRLDLVLSHRTARVSVLLNRGRGRFASSPGSPFALASRPFAVAVADLDRDQHLDLIGATADGVTVLLSDGVSASSSIVLPRRARRLRRRDRRLER